MTEHVFWLVSRSAGITAVLAASVSVTLGLLMSLKLMRDRWRLSDVLVVHQTLSLLSLGAIAVHALVLLGDGYLQPSLADLTVPFWSDFSRGWTTLGIVAGWALVALSLSYYARERIGRRRWRRLHRWTALVWVMSLVHALGQGTDAGSGWFQLLVAAFAIPPTALLAVRLARLPTLRSTA